MVALVKNVSAGASKTKVLNLIYGGGEAGKPSFTHHAEDNMKNTSSKHKWQQKWRFLQKCLTFATLRGMFVTEVMAFIKYMLLVLMIYT